MTTIPLTTTPPEASWWVLAPWLVLGGLMIVVGVLGSRGGPR